MNNSNVIGAGYINKDGGDTMLHDGNDSAIFSVNQPIFKLSFSIYFILFL